MNETIIKHLEDSYDSAEALIKTASIMLERINEMSYCLEASIAIDKLDEAIMALDSRKRDREKCGVEGISVS